METPLRRLTEEDVQEAYLHRKDIEYTVCPGRLACDLKVSDSGAIYHRLSVLDKDRDWPQGM